MPISGVYGDQSRTKPDKGSSSMSYALRVVSKISADRRSTAVWLGSATIVALLLGCPSAASAQTYASGQRIQCDATGLHSSYHAGTVIAAHPGETFNGYAAGSGYFYRVRIDGGDPEGTLCKAEDMRAGQPAASTPLTASRPPAIAPAAPVRLARPAPVSVAGNRFGTRDPRSCTTVRTKPNFEQIKALVQCEYESASHRDNNLLYLDQNLSIQVGGTRPYNQFSDGYATGIDTTAPVIPITGSADAYQCAALSKYANTGTVYDTDNTNKNCAISPVRQAQGTCYRRTVGDWLCHLYQVADSSITKLNQPPPR